MRTVSVPGGEPEQAFSVLLDGRAMGLATGEYRAAGQRGACTPTLAADVAALPAVAPCAGVSVETLADGN
ncbi:hypothetical protein EC2780750_0484 [Escherichia coli 2780750]|nr:hypothetical protein EC2780750_0484 [Escherichia coli 2780750]